MPQSAGGGISWDTISKLLNSKGFEIGIGALGAGLESAAQGRRAEQAQAQNAAQFRANLAQRLLEQQQGRRDLAAARTVTSTGLGDEEAYRARQAFAAAMLPGLRNFQVTPSDPRVAAAMPRISGGFQLPPGGLPPPAIAQFGPEATADALMRRRQQLSALQPTVTEEDDRMIQILQQALQEDAAAGRPAPEGYEYDKKTGQLKKKGGGFLGGLGKVLGFAAPIAASFIPGVGPLAATAIGAGAGAASGALQGGGLRGALGGAMSGTAASLLPQLLRARPGTPPINPRATPNPFESNIRRGVRF